MDWIESRIRVNVHWISASTCPSKPLIKFNGFPFLLHLYVKFNIKVKVFLSDYPNIYMYGNQVQWIRYNLLPFLDNMLRGEYQSLASWVFSEWLCNGFGLRNVLSWIRSFFTFSGIEPSNRVPSLPCPIIGNNI